MSAPTPAELAMLAQAERDARAIVARNNPDERAALAGLVNAGIDHLLTIRKDIAA